MTRHLWSGLLTLTILCPRSETFESVSVYQQSLFHKFCSVTLKHAKQKKKKHYLRIHYYNQIFLCLLWSKFLGFKCEVHFLLGDTRALGHVGILGQKEAA